MIFKRLRRGVVVGILALCASLSATSAYSQESFTFSRLSVGETLESFKDNRFSILLEAAEIAGLSDLLADTSLTGSVFPPNNSAFEALGQDAIDDLFANPDVLRNVLLYHLVPERLSESTVCRIATDNGGSYVIQSVTGEDIVVSCDDLNTIQVNGLTVIPPELRVNSNRALIHEINGLLIPGAFNRPPLAQADSFGPLTAGSQGLLQVLGNDTDPDGHLDPASVMIISQPSHGTAVPQPDGTVLYTHNGVPGTGSDSFTYTVKDTDGLESNVVTVTISPIEDVDANNPPQAADDSVGPINQGASSGPVDVLGNDSDSDGSIDPATLTIVRQPANGTASVVNGQIVYVHNGRGSTTDSLVYVVADDDGAPSNEATVTFTINAPANVPPVANDDSFGPVDQGSTTPLDVAANDSDVDGNIVPGTIVILGQPQNGTATVEGGQIVYVNDGSGAPSDTLTYTIRDDDGEPSNVATVVISLNAPANQPPVAADDSFGPVDQGSTTPLNVAGNDSDPDGSVVPGTIVIVSQ
ncbi:MAG: Ig-like domain-containing protein, partial [Granulosicoccus sp.]